LASVKNLDFVDGTHTSVANPSGGQVQVNVTGISDIVKSSTVTLSSSDILNLTTPITIFGGSGAGFINLPLYVVLQYKFGTTAYATTGTNDLAIYIRPDLVTDVIGDSTGLLDQTANAFEKINASGKLFLDFNFVGVNHAIKIINNSGVNYTIYGPGNTNTTLTITGLVPGSSHQWGVRAFDGQGYHSAFNYGFTVVNPVPVAPHFTGAMSTTAGGFQLTVSEGGSVLQTVLIQATTNPADPNSWVQIGSVLPSSNPFTFIDTNADQYPARFYRILAP